MPKNRYYYYDSDACSFVEVKTRARSFLTMASLIGLASISLTLLGLWGMSHIAGSPHELALRSENQALLNQLESVETRIHEYSSRIEDLYEADQRLYRMLLYADPIPEDVRRVGVGGTDEYPEFRGFSASTSAILRTSGEKLDYLERQISLQSNSYRELFQLARERDTRLDQLPAILPTDGLIVSGHGARMHPIYRSMRMHHGIDIVVDIGTPVHATADGVITFAGSSPGYGLNVRVKHPKTSYTTLYAHLSTISKEIRRGVRVQRGDQIGLSGDTGSTTGPHLHYEVRDEEGNSLNPIYFFAPSMTPEEYRRALEMAEASTTSLD